MKYKEVLTDEYGNLTEAGNRLSEHVKKRLAYNNSYAKSLGTTQKGMVISAKAVRPEDGCLECVFFLCSDCPLPVPLWDKDRCLLPYGRVFIRTRNPLRVVWYCIRTIALIVWLCLKVVARAVGIAIFGVRKQRQKEMINYMQDITKSNPADGTNGKDWFENMVINANKSHNSER